MAQAREVSSFRVLRRDILARCRAAQDGGAPLPSPEILHQEFRARFDALSDEWSVRDLDCCVVSAWLLSVEELAARLDHDFSHSALPFESAYRLCKAFADTGQDEKFSALLEKCHAYDTHLFLQEAVRLGSPVLLEALLREGVSMESKDSLLLRALELSCGDRHFSGNGVTQHWQQRVRCFRSLLEHGAPTEGVAEGLFLQLTMAANVGGAVCSSYRDAFAYLYAACAAPQESVLQYMERSLSEHERTNSYSWFQNLVVPAISRQIEELFPQPELSAVEALGRVPKEVLGIVAEYACDFFSIHAARAECEKPLPQLVRESKLHVLRERLNREAYPEPDLEGKSLLCIAVDEKNLDAVHLICAVLEKRGLIPDPGVIARVGEDADPISRRVRQCAECVAQGVAAREGLPVDAPKSGCCAIQ